MQYSLLTLLDLWKRGEISLERLVKVTSENVAERFSIKNRGRIAEGYYADLAIVNPLKPHTVTESDIKSKCAWSPFLGHTFACSVEHTIISGNLVIENQKQVSDIPGMPLEFDRL